jgi:hypothetical protein
MDESKGIFNSMSEQPLTLTGHKEHDSNPFIEKLVANESIIPCKKTVKKNEKAYLQEGGEEITLPVAKGGAVYFWADERKFSKVFAENVKVLKTLSAAAMQMFLYMVESIKPNSDLVYMKATDFLEYAGMKSRSQYYVAAVELIEKEIIAKTKGSGVFYINPCFVFNGNVAGLLPDASDAYVKRIASGTIKMSKATAKEWKEASERMNKKVKK